MGDPARTQARGYAVLAAIAAGFALLCYWATHRHYVPSCRYPSSRTMRPGDTCSGRSYDQMVSAHTRTGHVVFDIALPLAILFAVLAVRVLVRARRIRPS
ncbi:MAG: hypothetical protein ACJ73S_11380 [Mycobacteriales bacterium]